MILIIVLSALAASAANVITPLKDGVIIEKGDDIAIERGLWTIIITLHDRDTSALIYV
jgi:hypothetical protein